MIQIGVKSEFRQNLGRLGLFYGNKTQVPLVNFQTVLQWSADDMTKLNVQIKPVDATLDAGAQIQQMITAECIDSYSGWICSCLSQSNRKLKVLSNFRFTVTRIVIPLQRNTTKLQHQTAIDAQQVLWAHRDEWRIILRAMEESRGVSCIQQCLNITPLTIYSFFSEKQRAQKVFKAQLPLDLAGAKTKLSGFGMQLLDGIDPNPDNMVCAGIIHTQSHQVGCLLRLEPNKQAQVSMVRTRTWIRSRRGQKFALLGQVPRQRLEASEESCPRRFVRRRLDLGSRVARESSGNLRVGASHGSKSATDFEHIFAFFLQMFRLTVRASKEHVTTEICELLGDQF